MKIRPALRSEAVALSALAFRSKGYWPYAKDLLELYRPQLEIHEDDIAAGGTFVGVVDGLLIGFYKLSRIPARLEFLFVEPEWIGRGYGKRLWRHALMTARAWGWVKVELSADQFAAEKFYRHLGCRIVGEKASALGPLIEMEFELRDEPEG